MLTYYNQNLHTHGIYCDGKNAYEDTVLRAIELGFDCIGFSGHCYTPFKTYSAMSLENTENYKKEIRRLQEKYKEQILVLCGIEFDMYSVDDLDAYDYVIGSVHYPKFGDIYLDFDKTADVVERIIQEHFGGDGMKFAKLYYESLAMLPQYAKKCDIVGHFDLITKHQDNYQFFDTKSPVYRKMALEALDVLAEAVGVFEVNTGAITRGYRKTPYPDPFILKEIQKKGCGIVISSDCHNNLYLDYHFKEALELVKACGFKEVLKMTPHGLEAFGI